MLLGLIVAGPATVHAAPSATLAVSATVVAGCLVVGGVSNYGTLAFGTYSALSTSVATTSLANGVTLQCTPGVTLNMKVDGGQNSSSGRNLKSGSSLVAYQLYRDAALSQALAVSTSVAVSYTDANNISLPIYGRVALPGTAPAGSYSDVLQVELSW
ncbi:Csu type fimbrial protein [Pseudomonas abieticivorans]|uniref:Csu type fimbrial protein n=1 Tax=Pseudomonas abieticivorans TaxID=2931382 RepID=UPI003F68E04C